MSRANSVLKDERVLQLPPESYRHPGPTLPMVQVGGLAFLEEEEAFGLWHPPIMPLLLK